MKTQRSFVIAAAAAAAVLCTSVLVAGGDRAKATRPKDVTLTGRVVDLHNFMTEKFESSDHAKCTQRCIQAGVPTALETADGLVIIGEGPKGAANMMAPLAFRDAELKGKLYERHGIRYLDVASAKAIEVEEEAEEDWQSDPGWEGDERGDYDDPGED